jgi:hypothetical protein
MSTKIGWLDQFVGWTPGTIREDTTSGAIVNPVLITGLRFPTDIDVFEGHLFVVNASYGTIGEYTLSAAPVNCALISALGIAQQIAIRPSAESVPDASSTWMLLLRRLTATFPLKHLHRRARGAEAYARNRNVR